MDIKKILVSCLFFCIILLVGCKNHICNYSDDKEKTSNNHNLNNSFQKSANTLFSDISKDTTKIIYWINDQSYEITNDKKISAFFSYLLSFNIEEHKAIDADGGRIVEFITPDNKFTLTLYDKGFLFNKKYYSVNNLDIDIVKEATKLLNN